MAGFESIQNFLLTDSKGIDLRKKKILSVGSGDAGFEQHLLKNKLATSIDCMDKISKNHIDEKTIEADFVQYNFKKKYDMVFFINSIQFIIGEPPMDRLYFAFIKRKLHDLIKPNGHIFVKIPKKEWFIENKPMSTAFLKSLDTAYKNAKLLGFKVINSCTGKYSQMLLLQKSNVN